MSRCACRQSLSASEGYGSWVEEKLINVISVPSGTVYVKKTLHEQITVLPRLY